MFTSSLRSHNFKSGNISGKIRHCDLVTKNPICVSFDIEERSESNENANAFIMSIFDFDVIQ